MGVEFREIMNWTRRRKFFASALVVLTLGVGIIIGTIISGRVSATREEYAPTGATLLAIPNPTVLSNGFSSISRKLGPAVVNISTTQVLEKPKSKRRSQSDPFGDFFDRFFNSPDDSDNAERSLGSGLIVDPKGFILTNEHVIDQATRVQVQLDGDPTRYNAHIIGSDKDTDLAVIKIDAGHALPTARLGNSDGVEVGDWVLAFGSPFGLNSTVTAGIVSAKDRENLGGPEHQFQHFIQTDAAINPGNSGGPLVNLAGEVIGIDTAIYTGSRGFEGVGFALPSNAAIAVYNQLVTKGKVVRGSIGVSFQPQNSPNPVLMKELGAPYGIVVEDVAPGSPADKAGLKPGDVITRVNGHAVHNGPDLVNPIAQTPIGQSVSIGYVRNKEPKETTVSVADRSKLFPELSQTGVEDQPQSDQEPKQMGVHVEQLTADLAHKLGLSKTVGANPDGVIVTDVEPASFAEDLGLVRADVITEINHVPVTSMADYRREMGKLKAKQDVLMKVSRLGANNRTLTMYLAGTVPAASTQ
ncbi:MAG TPA: Do family serine endopeptidase [Candidatus Acidoferrales bacterium]|nr:Do family serine endopeptidase [Candidatus Acidoferrales bacterium]